VESARNLTIHDVIINEARIHDSWHDLYFAINLILFNNTNSIRLSIFPQ